MSGRRTHRSRLHRAPLRVSLMKLRFELRLLIRRKNSHDLIVQLHGVRAASRGVGIHVSFFGSIAEARDLLLLRGS